MDIQHHLVKKHSIKCSLFKGRVWWKCNGVPYKIYWVYSFLIIFVFINFIYRDRNVLESASIAWSQGLLESFCVSSSCNSHLAWLRSSCRMALPQKCLTKPWSRAIDPLCTLMFKSMGIWQSTTRHANSHPPFPLRYVTRPYLLTCVIPWVREWAGRRSLGRLQCMKQALSAFLKRAWLLEFTRLM